MKLLIMKFAPFPCYLVPFRQYAHMCHACLPEMFFVMPETCILLCINNFQCCVGLFTINIHTLLYCLRLRTDGGLWGSTPPLPPEIPKF
jgi:hypothetical protein